MSKTDSNYETPPSIDYGDWDAVHQIGGYEDWKRVRNKIEDLTPGDRVRVNDRGEAFDVITEEEAAPQTTCTVGQTTRFLYDGETTYRLRIPEDTGYPRLDEDEFSDDEYVAFLSVEAGSDE